MLITKRNAYNRKVAISLLVVNKDNNDVIDEFYPQTLSRKVFLDASEKNTILDHINDLLDNKHVPRSAISLLKNTPENGGLVKLNEDGVIPFKYTNPKSIVLYFEYKDIQDLLDNNNLDPDEDYGRLVMVSDIGQSNQGRSWGIYRLIGRDTHSIDSYQRIISPLEMDRTADWSEFAELFKHTPDEIDEAVNVSHDHSNKEVLDNITEHDDGYLYYHGKRISVRDDFRAIVTTKDANLADVLNGDLAVKLESERDKVEITPLEPITEIKVLEGNRDYEYRGDDTITSGPLLRTSKLTSAKGFFTSCINLSSIPWYDTKSITAVDEMFKDCPSLQAIHSFNFSKLETADYFCANSGIKSLPEIYAPRLTSGKYMFYNCEKLQTVERIKIPNAKDVSFLFANCSSLTAINSDIDLVQATNTESMFDTCRSLKYITDVNTPRTTNMRNMFKNCVSLRDVSYIDFSSCKDATDMFLGCGCLKHVRIKGHSLHTNLSLAQTNLDEASIRKILNELPNVVSEGGYTLDITNTPAADSLLEAEVSAMLVLGWTIKR